VKLKTISEAQLAAALNNPTVRRFIANPSVLAESIIAALREGGQR